MVDNRYSAKVVRIAPYRGEWSIQDGDKVAHTQAVRVMYDSIFGLDMTDMAEQRRLTTEFVHDINHNGSRWDGACSSMNTLTAVGWRIPSNSGSTCLLKTNPFEPVAKRFRQILYRLDDTRSCD